MIVAVIGALLLTGRGPNPAFFISDTPPDERAEGEVVIGDTMPEDGAFLAWTERVPSEVVGSAAHAEDGATYVALWEEYGLPESPPEVDFDRYVVLFFAMTRTACSLAHDPYIIFGEERIRFASAAMNLPCMYEQRTRSFAYVVADHILSDGAVVEIPASDYGGYEASNYEIRRRH